MRWALGLGLSVLGIALACGGEGGEAITAVPVSVNVSSFSAHDPSSSLITIAVKFEPALSSEDEPTLEVLDRETDEVISTLTVDETVNSTVCSSITRVQDWEIFSIRGPSSDELQLNADEHKLRLTIRRDGQEKHFLLDVPSSLCVAIE